MPIQPGCKGHHFKGMLSIKPITDFKLKRLVNILRQAMGLAVFFPLVINTILDWSDSSVAECCFLLHFHGVVLYLLTYCAALLKASYISNASKTKLSVFKRISTLPPN